MSALIRESSRWVRSWVGAPPQSPGADSDNKRNGNDAQPAVTVAVPAYKPDDRFVGTISSLAAQSYTNLVVRVSLDYAPDRNCPDLPDFPDLDLEFLQQPQRLGWVGNVNALLKTVRTPYCVLLMHDDQLTPAFIEAAVAALEANPQAVVAHGAIRYHGIVRPGQVATTDSIRGARSERIMAFIEREPHVAELCHRGVFRSELIDRGLRLRTKRSDGQFSNTLMALELLLHGDSIAIPDCYYEKFTAPDGLSREMHGRGADRTSHMLADNVACLFEALQQAKVPVEEVEPIVAGYVAWMLSLHGNWNVVADEPNSDARPYGEVRPALARFIARSFASVYAPDLAPASSGGRAGRNL